MKHAAKLFLLLIVTISRCPAMAQTYTVLHQFDVEGSGDGIAPTGSLIMDSAGNLYGTTLNGGSIKGKGWGTVFTVNSKTGAERVLYRFGKGSIGGADPTGKLLLDSAGNLYGTLSSGIGDGGYVYALNPSTGKAIVLHKFFCSAPPCSDGNMPNGGLVFDAAGNIYGTTFYGGVEGRNGVVFKLDRSGTETVLYEFCSLSSCSDGANPAAGLLIEGGNLYGTTSGGGTNGRGVVFKLGLTGRETVLHNFNGRDGWSPTGLIADPDGNLYGITEYAGLNDYGTAFMLGRSGREAQYDFCSLSACIDGSHPHDDYLVRDVAGNLYGTTQAGGAYDQGTIFMLSRTGKETVLHSFDCSTGCSPSGGLLLDSAGNLYGTTIEGGTYDNGVVFKLSLQ